MAQNLIIANAQYNDVPSVSIPKQGGGSASFIDTSDGTVVAEDVLENKVCYSQGVRIVGTGTGGSATKYGISIDDLLGEVNSSGQLQHPDGGDVDLVISGFTSVANYVLNYKFARSNAIKSVVFTDLQHADGTSCLDRAFNNCTNLISASFPSLVSANGQTAFSYCFQGDTKLVSASFPLLEEATQSNAFQYLFGGCTLLESIDFSSLRVVGNSSATGTTYRQFYYAFQNCNKMTSITFPALEEVWCNGTAANMGTFSYNAKVTKFYFPKLHTISKTASYGDTTGANNIFSSCNALTEIHFASANRTAIESSTGYATKWGRSSATIYFDL